jgi:short-subunit dehydrogenase
MTKFRNKVVLITGGASGIGKLMGEYALDQGAKKLIIWDINEKSLDQLVKEHKDKERILTYHVDVTNTGQINLAALEIIGNRLTPDILINNAGIVVGKFFNEHSFKDIDITVDINIKGPMYVTAAFLPEMMKKEESHIVNIASAAGMLSNPKMSVYAASKWAIIGWSESVRLEQEKMKTGVRVTTVTPSYIDTGMFKGVKMNPLIPILKPETATRKIVNGIEKNKIFVRMPAMVHLIPFLKGITPVKLFDAVASMLGVYDSMNDFKGRGK